MDWGRKGNRVTPQYRSCSSVDTQSHGKRTPGCVAPCSFRPNKGITRVSEAIDHLAEIITNALGKTDPLDFERQVRLPEKFAVLGEAVVMQLKATRARSTGTLGLFAGHQRPNRFTKGHNPSTRVQHPFCFPERLDHVG